MELEAVKPAGQGGFRDRLDKKVADWLQPWDGNTSFDIGLLGAPLSKTSISHSGAFQLPQAVRQAFGSYGVYNLEEDVDIAERLSGVDLGDVQMHATDMKLCHENIYLACRSFWNSKKGRRLFLLGGDHSITTSSVRALAEVLSEPLGIIHFDAHHDMRNVEDGGPTNGTPFRRLLDAGVIEGDRLVQIGLRNFANAKAYTQYARDHGVHLVTVNQVRRQGLAQVLKDAIDIAGAGGASLYVSFDIDVLDQAFVPGVPAPGPYGLEIWEACEALQTLGSIPQVVAFDWVCADPTVDVRNLTARVAANLMLYAATGIALQTLRE